MTLSQTPFTNHELHSKAVTYSKQDKGGHHSLTSVPSPSRSFLARLSSPWLARGVFPSLVLPNPRCHGERYPVVQLPVLCLSYKSGTWLLLYVTKSDYCVARKANKVSIERNPLDVLSLICEEVVKITQPKDSSKVVKSITWFHTTSIDVSLN